MSVEADSIDLDVPGRPTEEEFADLPVLDLLAAAEIAKADTPRLDGGAFVPEPGFVPQVGRSVVVCIAPDEWRPAQIVKVWNDNACNLVVFLDGNNDAAILASNPSGVYPQHAGALVGWKPSAVQSNTVGGYLPRVPTA